MWSKHPNFVAIDIETTGLHPNRGDRIIEIGAVAIESLTVVDEFHSLVSVNKRISVRAKHIHGIDENMLAGQPLPEEVLRTFQQFIGENLLVAHNARFDIDFLRHEFRRLGIAFNPQYICTLKMSRKFLPGLPGYRLETVARHLFGDAVNAITLHRALDDARLTARVWLNLKSQI